MSDEAPNVDERQRAILAVLAASSRVRDGRWIKGAPSHVLAELLTELERDGWRLITGSLVASYRDAIAEIAEAQTLDEVRAICANGPLADAPGSVRARKWNDRLNAAARAYSERTVGPVRVFSLDAALKAAGLRDLIVERDVLRVEVEDLRQAHASEAELADSRAAEVERLREAGKLVADDSYRSKCSYERAQGEVARLQAYVKEMEDAARADAHQFARNVKSARIEGARQERERLADAIDERLERLTHIQSLHTRTIVECQRNVAAVLSEEARADG